MPMIHRPLIFFFLNRSGNDNTANYMVNLLLHRSSLFTRQQHTDIENIVGKGEIARNEQFLLFPQCLQLNHLTVSPICPYF